MIYYSSHPVSLNLENERGKKGFLTIVLLFLGLNIHGDIRVAFNSSVIRLVLQPQNPALVKRALIRLLWSEINGLIFILMN